MEIKDLLLSFNYITSIPYFWASMGMTTAIALLVTAMLFDHDLRIIQRAFMAKFLFILILFLVTYTRINYSLKLIPIKSEKPFAGLVTLFVVTFFWFLGILLSVILLKIQERIKEHG